MMPKNQDLSSAMRHCLEKSIVKRASSINGSRDGSVSCKYLTLPHNTPRSFSFSTLALLVLPANYIMYSLPAVSAGIIIMMAGQIYAAAIRRFPAGRGTSADTSDPLSDVDFYFPFKDLQSQIQSANILCPAPGGPYDTALSLITTNCPSSGTDNVPINPCCTQGMLKDLAGAVGCVQDSDTSLASSMQSATTDFIQQCQQAGVNGLSDPFSTSSSVGASFTSIASSSSTITPTKSATSTISTSSSSSPSISVDRPSTSFAPSSSSGSSNSASSTSPTSQSSSAIKTIPFGPSSGSLGATAVILVTMLVMLIHT
ncbi:hypothetical protein C8J55DRAFT_498264 [Lentinula edodes]|uniref:Uncharacterized protein n=1 Tax=Lentinula lateritia TaxID=40482 RepID=A0A9W9B2M3_9AGAR|nr:hypothetical protein C8J55DRAFT_498264 [Lentinula edodes]